jgi:hypothetical protein
MEMAGFGIETHRVIATIAGVGATVGAGFLGVFGVETRLSAQANVPSRIESACTAEYMQSVASGLTDGVIVKAVKFGPSRSATRFIAADGKRGAYCQVTGSFVTSKASGKTANFLATFPETWNGKYLQLGCSGHCGQFYVSDAGTPAVTVTAQGYAGQIIEKGYASFATDEGHEGFDPASWAIRKDGSIDQDMLDDFLFRSQQVLSRMGKQFTMAVYTNASGSETSISRSYFNGCSGGGRDAMVAATHFPEAFDGIIAGSPYDPQGMAFQMSALGVAMKRTPDARISPAQFAMIDGIVKAQCDAIDGVKDGVIQNPAACNFNPDRDLRLCKAGETGGQCFSQAQIETISVAINAVTDERGNVVQPGYSISELDGLVPEIVGLADPLHKVFVRKNDPKFETASLFSFRRGGPGPVQGYHAVVKASDVALNRAALAPGSRGAAEKMTRLKAAGTKLLIWHNWSDEKLTPYSSINWYTRFARAAGGYAKAQSQVRLFMLPGTTHCSITGVAPNGFDSIGALENWVEKGEAPSRLMANVAERQFSPGAPKAVNLAFPNWTMPLCKFPEQARYSGKGDVKDGTNWICPVGNTALLKAGASGISAGMAR